MTRNTGRATARRTQDQTVETPEESTAVALVETQPFTLDMPSLTVEYARRTDVTEAEIEGFLTRATEVTRGIAGAGNALMWQGALNLTAAVNSGLVGKGKRWENQEHYGAEVIDAQGKPAWSRGYVSKMASIGRAAAVHGLEYGSEDYSSLILVLQGSTGTDAQRKAVRDALKGTDSDLFRKSLGLFREAVEAAKAAKAVTAKATPAEGSAEGSDETPAAETRAAHGSNLQVIDSEDKRPRDARPTVGDCRMIVTGLGEKLHQMPADAQDEVFEMLYSLVAEVTARREALGDIVTGEVTEVTDEVTA